MDTSKEARPAEAPGTAETSEPRTGERPTLAPRVLVVDDSGLVRRVVHGLLAGQGYRVQTASSGEEAFHLCLTEPFDMVISDVTMGALSGFQLCRLLRSDPSTADLPVILLTAANDPRSRFWGRNAGADEYLAKEAMRTDLVGAVERQLQDRAPRSRAPAGGSAGSGDPMHRLAQVLDRHLFDAVVAGELRQLMDYLDSRAVFARAVLRLASEVTQYGYLALLLDGPEGPTCTIQAQGPWPERPGPTVLSSLGISSERAGKVELILEGEVLPEGQPLPSGEMALFPIRLREEGLGELILFGGTRRIAPSDRRTIDLVARELGVMTKSMFLVEETRRLAQIDELTGLANRRATADRVRHEIARSERSGKALSVVLCDVDCFKQVNDTFGHGVGDEVLQGMASTLAGTVRQVDLVGRWGGEEFLAVLPEAAEPGGRIVAERLRCAVARMGAMADGPEGLSISLGVATHQPHETADQLVDRADEALYRAKERGRNRVEVAHITPSRPAPAPGPDGSVPEGTR
ncbi:MAG: diguanylate cyclase [Myxococcota bacterium]